VGRVQGGIAKSNRIEYLYKVVWISVYDQDR
jgi:hypothetical protein